jgi:predicted ATPase
VEQVEAWCAALARQGQFVQAGGLVAWPDGTVSESYQFRHMLYQQVVYDRVPVGRRLRLHRRIGVRLEAGYQEQASAHAAELALHFERGWDYPRAIQYLQQAADNAAQRHAPHEVIALVTQGLALLATLPETPARAQWELNLQLALGPALIATKGQASPEVEHTYAWARALCAQVGETPQLFPTLRGLWRFYRSRGALLTARELGEQLHGLAQQGAEPTHLLEVHDVLGTTLFFLGEYAAAWTHLAQAIALTDPMAQQTLALRHGEAPGPRCLAIAANALWCLGFPAQAVRRIQEALALAQDLGHPYSLGVTQHWVAYLYYRCRDAQTVQAQADALLPLATAQGFPILMGCGTCWRGWALAMQGESEAGLAQLRQGLAAIVATEHTLSRSLCLVLLAEAAGHIGQVEDGLRLLAEILPALAARGQGELLTEAYRLQGDLLLRQVAPDAMQAETCFQQALAVARHQQAKSWELRAAMSLSRLWQQQGKRTEGYDLLAPVYGWFTEGFDTPDLKEAKALLEALDRGPNSQ